MRAMLVSLLLVATPALASPQHGEPAAPHGAKPTAAPAAHRDEPKAAAHGGSKNEPKPAAHATVAEKASAAHPTASVTVVRVPRALPPPSDRRELVAAMARISQRLSAIAASAPADSARGQHGVKSAHRIQLVWRSSVAWPTTLTGEDETIDPLDAASCQTLDVE